MRSRGSLAVVVFVAIAGFVLAGCPAPPPPQSCPEPADGAWFGSWQSTAYPLRGTVEADLVFSGSSVSGTATLQNTSAGAGTVSGTLECDQIAFTVSSDVGFPAVLTVTGTVASDSLGFTISGQYNSASYTTVTTTPTGAETGRFFLGWPG